MPDGQRLAVHGAATAAGLHAVRSGGIQLLTDAMRAWGQVRRMAMLRAQDRMSSEKIEKLKAYLGVDPGNVELACDLADLQFAAGAFGQVEAAFAGLPAEGLGQPGVQFRLARLALVNGAYAQAERMLAGLLAAGHDLAAVGHDLAFAQLCQRRPDAAAATLDQTIQRHGATPELRVLQARVALMAEDYPCARQALDDALSLEPEHSTALGLRALVRLDEGDAEGAREAAADCLSRYPDQHEALLAAGTVALWQGDARQAEAHFARALARFPNSGRALSGSGQVLMLAGRLDEAEHVLERAVAAMPDHIGTWHALGWVQLLQGDLSAAERSYRSAYDLDRNFAESHGGLAVAALLQGRLAEGEAAMTRALKLEPRSVSGRYARSLWLETQGEHDRSAELFAGLLEEGALPGVSGEDAGAMAARLKARALSGRGT